MFAAYIVIGAYLAAGVLPRIETLSSFLPGEKAFKVLFQAGIEKFGREPLPLGRAA